MKNNKINKERVEVMALFGYEMAPCQPLYFKRIGGREVEVTELIRAQIKFLGASTKHIFDVMAGKIKYQLEFDSTDLVWTLTQA